MDKDQSGVLVRLSIPKGYGPTDQKQPFCLHGPNGPNGPTDQTEARKALLDFYKTKQAFKVSVGKSTWIDYNTFDSNYNLRQILDDEVVIEFDCNDPLIVLQAIMATGINLYNAGLVFEQWSHNGKSPHLHIHDLPIAKLDSNQRHIFKKLFIKRYVPIEYLKYADLSLTGVKLIALEWSPHWKSQLPKTDKDHRPDYTVKRLIARYEPEVKNE